MITERSLIVAGRRGRRPRAHVRATERVEFVVTPDERADLLLVAKAEGRPLASVIRDAVNEFVADYREKTVFSSGNN